MSANCGVFCQRCLRACIQLLAWIAPVVVLAFILFVSPSEIMAQTGCCTVAGNVDCSADGIVDISDLTRMVDYLFFFVVPLCCPEQANTDGDPAGSIDISDLTRLVDYLFLDHTPVEPCPGTELTYEARSAVMNSIDSAFASMAGAPDDSVANGLADFLRSLPEIDSAAVIDSVSVWAWFTDDRILVIPNNRFPDSSVAYSADWPESSIDTVIPPNFVVPERRFPDWDGVSELPAPQKSSALENMELPQSVQARVISTLSSTCFTPGAPKIKTLLEDHGYVTVPSTGSVPALLNVSGDGIFFMDAHGGRGQDRSNNYFLAIWTASPLSYVGDSVYKSMLRKHELVYMYCWDYTADSGGCATHWRYAITGKFVAQYMNFASNSLVIIDACFSDSVASLRNGFQAAGAGVYCGWTKTVFDFGANRAAEFLVDRLLGSNASTLTPVESPPQRAFEIDYVWQDMTDRGFDVDPHVPHARMRMHHLSGNFGLLAPSIRYMLVLEHTDSLFITGIFGSNPGAKGRVIVGGTEMLIYDWQQDMISCFIPNTGVGSAGPVTVEVDGITGPTSSVKRTSNPVNLTEWRGHFIYTQQDAGTMVASIDLDLHLRADVHYFREVPHAAPTFYSIITEVADDSYGTAEASGTYSYTHVDNDPPDVDTWTWSGSAPVVGIWNTSGTNFFLATGQFDNDNRKLNFMMQASAWNGLLETLVNSEAGLQYASPFTVGTPIELYDAYPNFYININNAWDILGDQRVAHTCCSHDQTNDGSIDDVTHTLTWSTIQSYFPPDTTAAQ